MEGNAENVKALTRSTNAIEEDVCGFKDFGNYKVDKGKKVVQDMAFDSKLKNESSAETAIMELHEFEENDQVSGVNSSASNKVIRLDYVAPQISLTSTRGVEDGRCNSKLRVMNYELPALLSAGKLSDNGETSTSRTQSLDMETLVANADQLSHSELKHSVVGSAKLWPSCTWVKRLKLNASNSFVGTSISNLGPAHTKNDLVLARSVDGTTANPEPIVNRSNGKELSVLQKSSPLSRRGESCSSESSGDTDSLLAHSWIQRWRHCQAAVPKMKPEPLVVCQATVQKKQFPSMAAMALMGKAMSGFQPCQFQKKGSFVVWD